MTLWEPSGNFRFQLTGYLQTSGSGLASFCFSSSVFEQEEQEERSGTLLVEDRDEDSGDEDSEAEDEARQQRSREAAWVDEDDELEEE